MPNCKLALFFTALSWVAAACPANEPSEPIAKKEALIHSAFSGDISKVVQLSRELGSVEVSRGTNLTKQHANGTSYYVPDGWTPLTAAIVGEQWTTAAYLIGAGADVNHTTKFGYSPLWFATVYGAHSDPALTVIDLLLAKKADNNIFPQLMCGHSRYGETPLDNAIHRQDIRVVKLFLIHGVDIHVKNESGTSVMQRFAMDFSAIKKLRPVVKEDEWKQALTIRKLLSEADGAPYRPSAKDKSNSSTNQQKIEPGQN